MNKSYVLIILLIILYASFTEHVRTGFGEANEVELPKWSVGDMWKFSADYKYKISMLGTVTEEITSDSRIISQYGSSYECYESNVTGGGTVYGQLFGEGITGTWVMKAKDYYQKSDLSLVKMTSEIEAVFMYATVSVTMNQIMEVVYNPPLEGNKGFPLTVGESWSATTTETTMTQTTYDGEVDSSTNSTTFTMNYFVLRSELITVSAGSFDTFVIRRTDPDGNYMETYYSPKAGANVKIRSYNATGEPEVVLDLIEYSYAAAEGEFPWFPIMVGGVITAVVVVSGVAYVLLKRKKPSVPLTPPTEQPSST